jgi:hypothetical protein
VPISKPDSSIPKEQAGRLAERSYLAHACWPDTSPFLVIGISYGLCAITNGCWPVAWDFGYIGTHRSLDYHSLFWRGLLISRDLGPIGERGKDRSGSIISATSRERRKGPEVTAIVEEEKGCSVGPNIILRLS